MHRDCERKKPIRTDRILCTRARIPSLFLSSFLYHTHAHLRSFFLPLINTLSSFLSFAYSLNLRLVRRLLIHYPPLPSHPRSISFSFIYSFAMLFFRSLSLYLSLLNSFIHVISFFFSFFLFFSLSLFLAR